MIANNTCFFSDDAIGIEIDIDIDVDIDLAIDS